MRRPAVRVLLVCGCVLAAVGAALADPAVIGIRGEAADDNYGWAIADAGDLNGDGIEDLVVTAIYNDQVASAAGKAYVYFGGSAFDAAPDVVMFGEAADDHFGVSAAAAGDVNGDGYGDLIVGARLNDRNGSAAGAAFIFFGGRSMDGVPDVVLVGEAADDWFGQSVSGAGDVNGDGFDDVIVGAPYNDRGGSAAGAAYVFFGGRPMDSTPDLILTGQGGNDQVGWAVAGGGDLNGDGYGDIAVGARLYPLSTGTGRVYVLLGGPRPDAVPDVILAGETSGDWFGNAVALLRDMDGDGFDDLAVGALYADVLVGGTRVSAAGKAYVFRGGNPMSTTPALVLSGETKDEQFGNDLRSAGDVNGDGFGDLIVGGHFFDPGGIRAIGKIYLYLGGRSLDGSVDFTMIGEAQDDQFGHAVGGADLNGDGLSELLATAVYNDQAGSGAGKAYVIFLDAIRVFASPDAISWASSFPFQSYNVYRGDLTDLRSGSYGRCLASSILGSSLLDPTLPDPARGFFYLVTGVNLGVETSLGFDSSGRPRPNTTPCP